MGAFVIDFGFDFWLQVLQQLSTRIELVPVIIKGEQEWRKGKREIFGKASLYNFHMTHSIEIISLPELRRNSGDRGTRKWIAYDGIVYDVTDCPKWRTEMHEQLHFPGQDLTSEIPDAPHKKDVFTRPCVKIVGRLA